MKYKPSKYNIVVEEKDNGTRLIYNTLTNCLCELDKETFDNLNNILTIENQESLPYFKEMHQQGLIVNENLNEFNKLIVCEHAAMINPNDIFLSFVIAPTMKCNLRCVYCFEACSEKESGFDDETMDSVLKYIKSKICSMPRLKRLNIDWFGGEPLLAYSKIVKFSKDIILFCKEKNIEYSACMLTNGVLLSKEKALVLKNECNLFSVQIPLDGTETFYCKLKNATQESYKAVIKNICDCCGIFRMSLRMNTNKENYEDIKKVTKYLLVDLKLVDKVRIYLAELKVFDGYTNYDCKNCLESKNFTNTKLDFLNFIRNELGYKNFKYAYQRPKGICCGLTKLNNAVIGPNGDFYRCEHHIGKAENVVGNCKEGYFYNDKEMEQLFYPHEKKCSECAFFPTCMGGCRNERIMKGRDQDFCDSFKTELVELLKMKAIDIGNKNDNDFGRIR